jgi:DNA modification methylase
MNPYFNKDGITIYHGTAEEVVRLFPDKFFGALITDPPFSMGQDWITGSAANAFLRQYDLDRLLYFGLGNAFIFTNPMHGFVHVERREGLLSIPEFHHREEVAPKPVLIHPHGRPVETIKGFIRSTNGKVFDPFMGSGSTLLAAQQLRRVAVGVDNNERYCEMAAQLLMWPNGRASLDHL